MLNAGPINHLRGKGYKVNSTHIIKIRNGSFCSLILVFLLCWNYIAYSQCLTHFEHALKKAITD